MAVIHRAMVLLAALLAVHAPLRAQGGQPVTEQNGTVTINLVDTDLRAAIQVLSPYLDRPVLFGGVNPARVTLQTPAPVQRQQVPALLRSLLASQNYELAEADGSYVVRPRGGQPGGPFQQPIAAPVQGRPSGAVQLFVIRLRHAKAADVAAVVNALYGRGGALGELGDRRPSTLADDLERNRLPPYTGQPAQAVPGAVISGRDASLAGETTIVPDPRTNSLLVRASQGDFELIQAAVREIDIRPLQVLVEVVIAEVQRNSRFAIGLSALLDTTRVRGDVQVGGGTTGGGRDGGITVTALNLGHYQISATLRAAAERGEATILSRPVLFAANNELANLSVGRQVPFVQATTRTDAGIPTDLVQYRDVSTQLQIVPTISPDGYVLLEVSQEVNSVEENVGVKDNPIISTRSLQTQLLVRDGQTGVLGGLSDQTRASSRGGIPLLSQLPLVGWVFGSRTRDTRDTELFVFLTPRVIRADQELDQATTDVRENSRHLQQPLRDARPYVQPAPPAGELRPKPGEGEP
ncbi:MAG TPA: secretin N-terminal domain-containing protein [Longimicrobium sp.]|nr:secretin N-terminal domain-containing protein [Longimicrobium sp.]